MCSCVSLFFTHLGGTEPFLEVMIESRSESKWEDVSALLDSVRAMCTDTLLVKVSYEVWFVRAA